MKDTVAIIGSHPRTRNEFDFNRQDADIWVFNEVISAKILPRADAVFQIHIPAIFRNPANRNDPHHYEWLQNVHDVTVYMQDVYADVPASRRYPLEDIVERFHLRYFTSSVAYAVALACHCGYKRIEIYGVEMETNTEWTYQRDGVSIWIGVALGLGIEVDAHISMFDQPLYGYEGKVSVEYEQFQKRIDELIPQAQELEKLYSAAMLETKKAAELLIGSNEGDIESALIANVHKQKNLGEQLGMIDGAIQENRRYLSKADTMKNAAEGEFLFSRQEFESAAKNLTDKTNATQTEFIAVGTELGIIQQNLIRSAKGSPKRARMGELLLQRMQVFLSVNNKKAIYQGAAGENFFYMSYLDKYVKAAGGERSEAVLLESMRVNAP